MKLIGKIVFLIFLALNSYGATAFLSKNSVILGESVVLVIQASGEDIKFPDISDIKGFTISSTGTQKSVQNINGKVTQTLEKQYEFLPTKSINVPSFSVEVDGKKQKTEPLHVEVAKATLKNSNFFLQMKVKKENVMQFEAIPVQIIFKRAANQQVKDLRFAPPKFDNFWVKQGKKIEPVQEGNFIVHTINLFLYPQKSGDYKLNPAQVRVGLASQSRDIFNTFTNQLRWKNIFSNSLSLHVKPLIGTNLYGNFDIKATVDKKSINSNEGTNFTISINGEGNFDDIAAYSLKINEANVYADKPEIKTFANGEKMDGTFSQKFSISSHSNFTIPSISITFFDAKLQKLVTKKTNPILINVKSLTAEKSVQISPSKQLSQKIVRVKVTNFYYIAGAFVCGAVFVLFILLLIYLLKKDKHKFPKFKNDRDLLKLMLKHRGKNKEIDEQILALEQNLYANGKNKIDKKVIERFI